ncbi:MAG: protease pro-enzyme activation domain-containing protein [Terracidiphilus sp.]
MGRIFSAPDESIRLRFPQFCDEALNPALSLHRHRLGQPHEVNMLRRSNSRIEYLATASGCLLAFTVLLAGSRLAAAQDTALNKDQTPPVKAYPDILPPVASGTLLGHTPAEVLNGTATRMSHYNPDQKLRLVLAIRPPHMADEEQFLAELVTKGSPNFHQFLSADEWNARFGPSVEDEQKVVDWAQSAGLTVTNRFANRLLVDVEAPAGVIEKVFGVTINNYQVDDEVDFSNDRDPVLPNSLDGIVFSVAGLNSIQRFQRMTSGGARLKGPDYVEGPVYNLVGSSHGDGDPTQAPEYQASSMDSGPSNPSPMFTNGYADPSNIPYSSQSYNYSGLHTYSHCCNPHNDSGGAPAVSSIALVTYGNFQDSDAQAFFKKYGLAYNYIAYAIDGTSSPGTDCVVGTAGCSAAGLDDEAPLDIEYSTASANSFGSYLDTAQVYVYEAVNGLYSTYEDVYNFIASDDYAKVASTSYGWSEHGFDSTGAEEVVMHGIFNSMVGTGWTLIAAAGDQGSTQDCKDAVRVSYPAADPDVIAAGGTAIQLYGSGDFDYEHAWTGGTASTACAKNNGGGGGGISNDFSQPSWQSKLGGTKRLLPDISLNAGGLGQNYYYKGKLRGVGGTSIVAPELAGFFAQENSYLNYIGNICGSAGNAACAPMGNPSPFLYDIGINGAQKDPYYDITKGCNSNNITKQFDLKYYCAGKGYDKATGWGSFNAMQLAWALNWQYIPSYSAPSVAFTGPAKNKWYKTNQTVKWTVKDKNTHGTTPASGVAGFTQGWDSIPADPYSEPHGGSGNSFYRGPEYPFGETGCLSLVKGGCAGGVSQGCHTAHVRAWDNQGTTSGDVTYGPVCYDTIAPITTASLSGTKSGSGYTGAVTVTLKATDNKSGVAATDYTVNGGSNTTYTGPFKVSYNGTVTVKFHSVDKAGNVESTKSISFTD